MADRSGPSIADRIHRRVHGRLVFDRRRQRLVAALTSALCDSPATVLDIGCGNGEIGSDLTAVGYSVVGVETLVREECAIPLVRFDGRRLPFPDGSFDAVVIVDVLHHTADPHAVLSEARRVTTGPVIIKDHRAESGWDRFTLSFMDWVGNRQFGVGRDGAYLSRVEWDELFASTGLRVERYDSRLDLYPLPAKPAFERGLHFVARLVADL